jgi:hypothetical protein
MFVRSIACFVRTVMRFVQKAVIRWDGFDQKYIQMLSVNDKNVDIQYWNSYVTPQRNNINNNNNISNSISEYSAERKNIRIMSYTP